MPKKYTYNQVKIKFKKEGWILLSQNYKDNKQKLDVKCLHGHKIQINLNNFLTGWRCKKCTKIYLRGQNHHLWKGGPPKCFDCGKQIWITSTRCDRCKYIANKNPNWQGGMGNFPYPLKFNAKLKEKIKERDNFICKRCGITEKKHKKLYDRTLAVHHIDYNKQNCQENNLITTCTVCNTNANYNRDYWYAYYKYIIEEFV